MNGTRSNSVPRASRPADLGNDILDPMIRKAAAEGYEREAGTYARGRPNYHQRLVDRFVNRFGTGAILDLAAGTGIFTAQLVAAGLSPIAVEPVDAMRKSLRESLPNVTALKGTAEDLPLPDSTIDSIAVAQAFHWFDHPAALTEIKRVLKPDGHLVCLWNVRDQSESWTRAFTALMDQYSGDTPRHATMLWRQAIDADANFELVDERAIDNPVPATPEAVVDRALSVSFIAALDKDKQRQVARELRSIVEPLGESFEFPYRSELQAWQLQ